MPDEEEQSNPMTPPERPEQPSPTPPEQTPAAPSPGEQEREAEERRRENLPDAQRERAEANAELEHSRGGRTTRDDLNDLGVPMLQGDGSEPVGPEDALGPGPKRGDYRERIGPANYQPHDGGAPQRPNAEDIGEVAGRKGGVETAGETAGRGW